ncbi:MAG: MarR family winged helix-turn-helix transcriptional regulator [Candidatus Limnocylindrales bacterium]
MSRPVQPDPQPDRMPTASAAGSLSADTFETSELLLALIEATRSGRAAAPTPDAARAGRVVSTHAIRAAIHVYQHGQRTVGQLASGLGISLGWASRVVSELEADGLVERRADRDDRRVVLVSLTAEAAGMVERDYRWRGDAVERALASLDPAGRAAVRTFLRQVSYELAEAARARR